MLIRPSDLQSPERLDEAYATRSDPNATLSLLAFLTLSVPAKGQDPRPRASGPGAEAGWAAYADNDMAEARRRFEAAVAQCDNDQYARTGLGYVYQRDGTIQEAERLWTVVGVAEPDNVDALVGLGLARWRSGDIDGVRDHFSAVIGLQVFQHLQPPVQTALSFSNRRRSQARQVSRRKTTDTRRPMVPTRP